MVHVVVLLHVRQLISMYTDNLMVQPLTVQKPYCRLWVIHMFWLRSHNQQLAWPLISEWGEPPMCSGVIQIQPDVIKSHTTRSMYVVQYIALITAWHISHMINVICHCMRTVQTVIILKKKKPGSISCKPVPYDSKLSTGGIKVKCTSRVLLVQLQ